MLNESIPTASATTASSTVLRMTTSPLSSPPDSSTLIGTNESNPNSMSWALLISGPPGSSRVPRLGHYLQLQIPQTGELLHMQVLGRLSAARPLAGDFLEPVPRRR